MRTLLLALSIALSCVANAIDMPPDSFMKLEVGVLRHYGSTSGYGFTLLQYAGAMKSAGGKQEWKKDNDKQWAHIITIDDNATGTKQRMALVFKEDGTYASIIRFVDNDKEATKDYVGAAADQIMLPIAQKLGSNKKTSDIANKQNAKTINTGKKPTLAGKYGDDEYHITLNESKDKFSLQLNGRCSDKDANIRPILIKIDGVVFKRGADEFEDIATVEADGCKLELMAVNDNGSRELRISEKNNCCQNFLSNILIKKK